MPQKYRFYYFLIAALLLMGGAAGPAVAQVQEAWVNNYNGPSSSGDNFADMKVDALGNVYVTGSQFGISSSTIVTVKYDAAGNQLWAASYDGPGTGSDAAAALAIDASGNVYVTGKEFGNGTSNDLVTIKYDANGNQLWVASYNGLGNRQDLGNAIAVDGSGNVYVTGQSQTGFAFTTWDYITIKYDAAGNEQWTRLYNGPANFGDRAVSIGTDAAGNIYVTGDSPGSGTSNDYATIKYDASGNELWVSRYNGPGNGGDTPRELVVDAAGNAHVTGFSFDSVNSNDIATVKYDTNGNEIWVDRLNIQPGSPDDGNGLALDAAGNVYLAGLTFDLTGNTFQNAVIAKYDSGGNLLWSKVYNGPDNARDEVYDIAVDALGDVYVTGVTSDLTFATDFLTIKFDANGNELWTARHDGVGASGDQSRRIGLDAAGDVYVSGSTWGGGVTQSDMTTIKYIPANNPPVVTDGSLGTLEDQDASGTLAGSDDENDPLTFAIDTPPALGQVTIDDVSTGAFTYTPNPDANGSDSFTFTADDGNAVSNIGTMNITITPVNDAPSFTAGPDQSAGHDAGPQTVSGWATGISAGPANESGQSLNFAVSNDDNTLFAAQPAVAANGDLSYEPAVGAGGLATVTVTLADDGGTADGGVDTSAPQTFTIEVIGPPDEVATSVVLATHRAWLKRSSQVISGGVIVNGADAGDIEDLEPEKKKKGYYYRHRRYSPNLVVGNNATTPAGYNLKADKVRVRKKAEVNSDVFYNDLQNKGTINGALNTPLDLPVITELPSFEEGTPGNTRVKVRRGRTETLAPGSYGDVTVHKGATLVLTGGRYDMRSLEVKSKGRVVIEAGSDIRIAERMKTGRRSYFGPGSGSGIAAHDIIVYVAGHNGKHRKWFSRRKAVRIGSRSAVFANVYAANGTIWIRHDSRATGSFIACEVVVGVRTQVTLDSYFAPDGLLTRPVAGTDAGDYEEALADAGLPDDFAIDQNYPNPFNPSTEISYELPEPVHVRLVIYNVLGQEVRTLVDGLQPAGFHTTQWNGRNRNGQQVGSGIYIYRIQAGDFGETKRMTLLK